MPVRLVQPIATGFGTSLAYPSSVQRGSLLVLASVEAAQTSIVDTQKNLWTRAVTISSGTPCCEIWWAVSASPGPNTVTVASCDVAIWEVGSGSRRASAQMPKPALDKTSSNSGTSTLANPGAVTPSYVDAFLVAAANGAATTISAGATGWTATQLPANDWVQTLITPVPSLQTGSFVLPNGGWTAVCAVFGFPEGESSAIVQPRPKPFLL